MFRIFLYGIIIFSSLVSVTDVFAATSDFTVQTFVGSDITPPTVPGSFTATPIATTQIDLAWTASTDDFLLGGYHIWRDDVRIATTSALSYADTGLTASTTYSYYVTAYDSFFNESASSTIEATTTFSIPPPSSTTTPAESQTGSKHSPFDEMILSIEILPQKDSVIIRYVTKAHIRSIIKWGRTSSYELGSLAERAFSMVHETNIAGLLPGTVYSFSIEGEDKISRYGTLYEGQFSTLPPEDTFAPGNIVDFKAVKDNEDIVLTWTNPNDLDFAKVRVVESDLFYPNDVADGWVVYEGEGTEARSVGKALPGTTHYYTIFTYDELGNISSGAVTRLTVDALGTVSTTTVPLETLNPIEFIFENLLFLQDGLQISSEKGMVHVDGSKRLTISIPYHVLPEHLKTILVVLGSNEDSSKQFTFLLRINPEKTFYTATLAPLGVSGEFPIVVSIFDYKTAQIGYAEGALISKIRSLHLDDDSDNFGTYILSTISKIGRSYLLWFVLLLILLAFMGRRLMQSSL
ncbi:MAG: hypothetical protein WAW13_00760 [Minisyncoccia bacterium]